MEISNNNVTVNNCIEEVFIFEVQERSGRASA